jgi:hypothetical protein
MLADVGLGDVQRPQPKQSDQPDSDQIHRHDEVQEFWHQQNQEASDEGDQGCQTKVNVHKKVNV